MLLKFWKKIICVELNIIGRMAQVPFFYSLTLTIFEVKTFGILLF